MNERRFHHQLVPMEVDYEPEFNKSILNNFVARGHRLKEAHDGFASLTAIGRDGNRVNAAYDPRRLGSKEVF